MATIEERLTAAGTNPQELLGGELTGGGAATNVGQVERWACAVGGGALAVYGVTRGSLGGIALALLGAALVQRGVTGHCNVYEAIDFSTAEGGVLRNSENVSVAGERGTKVEKSVTVGRPAQELYAFWRNFENLPRFMNNLESVTVTGPNRSRWVAKAPAGSSVEWEAEVYNEKPGELIAWRSLEGSQVANAGSVRFESAGDASTLVRVSLKYDPPGGKFGSLVARLFGENPERQIEEDLNRFKDLMESGTSAAAAESEGRGATAGK